MKSILSAVIGATLSLFAIHASPQTAATEQEVSLTTNSTTTLAEALDQWAAQGGYQLFAPKESWDIAKTVRAPSLKGRFSAQAALDQLLYGTPLTYVWIRERTVSIRQRVQTIAVPMQGVESGSEAPAWNLLPALAMDDRRAGAGSELPQPMARDRTPGRTLERVEEVVVTGSRLRRGNLAAQVPVTTFDSDQIKQLGVTNIADVLKFLPQQTFSTDERFNAAGGRAVQLRGLGLGDTLVLINGRRTVTSAIQSSSNFFDLNTIPLTAVERVEVLSDSASAVYGADAVGGVVNIILKDTVEAPTLDLYYGAADGGADERRASFDIGHATDTFRGSIVLDYFDRQFLMGSDRDRSANQDYTRFGSTDMRFPYSNPGNVCSLDGTPLPGLQSTCAAIPSTSGVGLTPADFAATDGQTNLESLDRFTSLVPESERKSAVAVFEMSLSNQVEGFGEFLWSDRTDTFLGWPALVGTIVPAENPFNPFDVPLIGQYLMEGLGQIASRSAAESSRSVLGLRGSVGSWDWELAGLYVSDKGHIRTENDVDLMQLAASLAATDPDQAFNIFQDGPGGSDQLLRSLRAAPIVDRYASRGTQVGGFVRGELFQLPGGSMQAVAGLEARRENIHFEAHSNNIVLSSPDRETSALFAEIHTPLVGASMDVPFVKQLSIEVAGRYDHYNDFGGTFNPQYAVEWNPLGEIFVRASYGTSFRAPALFELHQPAVTFPSLPVFDPVRNELAVVSITTGGNVDLQPQEADSFTVGLAFAPDADSRLPSARLSYWSIKEHQRVQRLSDVTGFLANEQFFPDRIVRGPSTTPGEPGPLLSFNATNLNFGRLETSGIDARISQSFPTSIGRFMGSVDSTWVDEYSAADFPNTPALERVGIANISGTIPRWRVVATLNWSLGGFDLSLTDRFVSGYSDAAFNVPNGRKVDSQSLLDMQMVLNLDHWFPTSMWLSGSQLRAGVTNLLDDEPEYSEIRNSGYDPTLGDLRQRFGYVSLTKSF